METTSGSWDVAELEAFRDQSDPQADALVQQIFASNSQMGISKLFEDLTTNNSIAGVELPTGVQEYFDSTKDLPADVDFDRIARGQDVFAQVGPEICLLLLCSSLPMAYSCAKGAEVMAETGRMVHKPAGEDHKMRVFARRLMETSQFVVNVCSPKGLEPEGRGIITAQKVRLIHATIRNFLLQQNWQTEKLGKPINQEDLAGTLQSFSSLILHGLPMLGVTLSDEQQEDFYYVWHVIGNTVGLDPKLNPPTWQAGYELGSAIFAHQKQQSEAGTLLTRALIQFLERIMPGNVFDHVPAVMIEYLVGKEIAGVLGVQHKPNLLEEHIPKLAKVLFGTEERFASMFSFAEKVNGHFNLALMQGMLNYYNNYKGVHFYLPPDLQKNWQLNVKWDHVAALSPSIFGFRLGIERKDSTL